MWKKSIVVFLFGCLVTLCAVDVNETLSCRDTPDGRKLPIAVYYESLCSDSQIFATRHLAPVYEGIKDHVELQLVPFGKSESENNGETFYCQHGPAECTANKMHSCVLDAIDNEQDASVRFLGCQMRLDADFSGKECALLVNVTYEALLACQTGRKGIDLQLKAENETHLVARPYPPFVPYIVYNRTRNPNLHRRSQREFGRVVCEQLAEIYCQHAMPSVCRSP